MYERNKKNGIIELMQNIRNAIMTGPTGAIGLALIDELVRHSVQVSAVCRPGSARIGEIPAHPLVSVIECDLSDLQSLSARSNHDYDVFYHFGWTNTFGAAARNDMDVQILNIRYSLDAVRAAAELGCHVFIGAGSQAEYGRVEGLLRPDTPCFPENGYGMAKRCAGEMTRIECEKFGLRQIWTRVLSVYGPGDGAGTLVSSVINAMLDGQSPACTAGEQQWDYLYSADAARAFRLLAESGKHGAVYPLGGGSVRPLKDYICAMRDAIDPTLPIGFGVIPYVRNQVMYLGADLAALTADTGFLPETQFEDGIKRTIAYLKTKRKSKSTMIEQTKKKQEYKR